MTRSESAASTFFRASESKQNIFGRDEGTMNGIETIEARFLCTFSQNQKMGTMEPYYGTHVTLRKTNVPSNVWEIDFGGRNHRVVASASLSMDVAKRLATPRGQTRPRSTLHWQNPGKMMRLQSETCWHNYINCFK